MPACLLPPDAARAQTHAANAAPFDADARTERELAHSRFLAREAWLTPREREVLDDAVRGLPTRQIAGRLGLSVKTVELYRARGMAKMRVRSVAELAQMMASRLA